MSARFLKKREGVLKRITEDHEAKKAARKDIKMYNVILSEERIKHASKYKIAKIPHPFTSREEYERSMKVPTGPEWNASTVVRENTKAEVVTRAGRLIEPARLTKGHKREAPPSSEPRSQGAGKRVKV